MPTKKNNQAAEVLEPEVEEIPLEQVIDTTLVKHNVTEAVIASLKEKYGGMQLKSLDDRDGYIDIKDARKEVRKIGIITEKICKHGREDAIKIQRLWINKEKEILGKISEVENPLNAEIEKFDNEVERKETEERKRQEEIYINRQSILSRMGAVYDNGSFVLNHISYEVELLKQADNDMWNDTILPKYIKEFEIVEAERVAEENKRKAELDKLRKEQEELLKQQNELREAQEKMRKDKEDLERQQRLEQDRKESEEKQKQQLLMDARRAQLRNLGLEFNYETKAYIFGSVRVDADTEIKVLNDTDWSSLIERITPIVQQHIKEAQQKIADDLEKQKQEAIEKALKDQGLKKQQAEQRKEEELAQANDKTKWEAFIASLNSVIHSEMKSPKYRKMQSIAKEKIEEIKQL